jgi:hypothetical protein
MIMLNIFLSGLQSIFDGPLAPIIILPRLFTLEHVGDEDRGLYTYCVKVY